MEKIQEPVIAQPIEETCGRHVQARELIDFAGALQEAATQAALRLLYGPPMPSKEACRAVGFASLKLWDARKALEQIAPDPTETAT